MELTLAEIYSQYGKQYPYACDAIAYYIFGDKSEDNIIVRAYKGVYGRHAEVDASVVSEYMLIREYSYIEDIEDINNFVANLPTANGETLSTYF